MSLNLKPRVATLADVVCVLSDLCDDDLAEIWALGFRDPMVLLDGMMENAVKIRVFDNKDGTPQVIYGVSREAGQPDTARVWVLQRQGTKAPKREYLRATRKLLPELAEGFITLFNWKWSGNDHHLPWLERLGFIVIRTIRVGDEIFHEFVRPST